jgi:hypothetical protein
MEIQEKKEVTSDLIKNLFFDATSMTPKIDFDCNTGIFEMSGNSIPENSFEFFRPVLTWLDNYVNFPLEKTVLKFSIEYFNTSSSKCFLDIFKKLEAIQRGTGKVMIEWHYDKDDEDMLEAGEDYESILNIPFKFVENK